MSGEDHILDVRGYSCPYPVFYTLMALDKLQPGETLDVILDNPPSSEDIPIAVTKRGYKVLAVTKVEDTVWRITIQK